ncbi:hypothetical protein VOLCADRAFT_108211 [Volvox carteri f. nagariensis]|uniref:Uncharacterized protein n=1 Tax=Volvox carteri f. nagariensis TaxID=3068 RepID=D8UIX1_VOLCA|nr:uncharacterized protein VOLCADRAFT_108211 [Volvox carteri f. nagariensis]EFJ40328.1 hypothetical protein VOLCADRAFT_108211 [Volvox carteri f. nagariensis]|eukprot:XP_002958591.1 hypothetical protein VOLCADRAFT_108211 [Volvox carteri f. nagariensis]
MGFGDEASPCVARIDRNCNQMTTDQQYKLAHAMNICFLTSNGHTGYKCTDRMSASECSKNLDNRAFTSYNMFFANIHSICLYVSNREFERHTSQLLNKLYEGAGAAQNVLHGVVQGLQVHHEQQLLLHQGLSQMREEQSGLAEGLQEGLRRLRTIQGQADTLQEQVNKTLSMEEELSRRQGDLALQMGALEQMEQQHAAAAELRWEQLLQRAAHMEERHAHYEALQEALAAKSGQLLQQSGQLQGAIETVLVAQQRTSSLLGRVLGGQWTLKDLSFYAGAAVCILVLTGPVALQTSRLPLLALLFMTAACERALRQYMQIWLPLLEGAVGLSPMPSFIGNMEQAGWLLRLLSGLAGCVLLMRRLLATRQRDAADRRVLEDIQLQLEHLAVQQALLNRHLIGADGLATATCGLDGVKTRQTGPQPSQLHGHLAKPRNPALPIAAPPTPLVTPIAAQMASGPHVPSQWTPSQLGNSCQTKEAAPQACQLTSYSGPCHDALVRHSEEAVVATSPGQQPVTAPTTSHCTAQRHGKHAGRAGALTATGATKRGPSCSKRRRDPEPGLRGRVTSKRFAAHADL